MATIDAIAVVELTEVEARLLTNKIKQAADELWRLLLEAHERRAWAALGYASWRHYALNEFGMGQSHAYRLLDQGRVIRALEEAAGSPVGEIVTERIARDLKPHLDSVTAEIESRVDAGEPPIEATKTVVSKTRTYLDSRKRRDAPNRWVESMVFSIQSYTGLLSSLSPIDIDTLDRDLLPEWITEIRAGAEKLLRFADSLERGSRR
jgi:hypothetical protein